MRLLVCGSRDFAEERELRAVLLFIKEECDTKGEALLIIQGKARGADRMVKNWADDNNIPCLDFPADWNKYGLGAGPIRNKQMLEEGKPDLVVAFPKNGDLSASKGTRNMVEQAREAGVRVIVHGEKTST